MPIKYFTWIVVIIGVQFVKTDNGNDSKITHFTPSRDARLTIVAQTENITKYPFMIAIKQGDFHFCSGSLISAEWVLSAAHCMLERSGKSRELVNIRMVAGASSSKDQVPRNSFDVQIRLCVECRIHEYEAYPYPINDIALLKAHRPFFLTKYVSIIKLLGPAIDPFGFLQRGYDNLCVQLGFNDIPKYEYARWGLTPHSDHLKKVQVRASMIELCQQFYPDVTNRDIICTTRIGNGDICWGDSGGPLVCPSNGENLQIGIIIVSGSYCGSKIMPRIHTKVDNHYKYIEENIKSLGRKLITSIIHTMCFLFLWLGNLKLFFVST